MDAMAESVLKIQIAFLSDAIKDLVRLAEICSFCLVVFWGFNLFSPNTIVLLRMLIFLEKYNRLWLLFLVEYQFKESKK